LRAIRFRYRPVRYLATRWLGRRRPGWATSPLGIITMDDVAEPELPGPDWVRVETSLSGICGTDLSIITARDSFTLEPFGSYPFVFGHENVGRVVETGPAVRGWEVGDRVVVNPMLACLQRGFDQPCEPCGRGEFGLCRRFDQGNIGTGTMIGYTPSVGGGWSRYFVAHVSQLHRPGDLADEVAVLTDPLASALRPVLLYPPRADDVVLVIGAGTIGALTVYSLRAIGWRGPIAVLGRHAFQFELAERAGATRVLRSRSEMYDWAASLPEAKTYRPTLAPSFVEGGPSLIFDTVGSETSVGDALALAREGGRIVVVGTAARIQADWTRVVIRQLLLAGVIAYGMAPFEGQTREIYEVSLDLMRRNGIADLGLLTHVFPLEDYRAALSAALDKKGHRSTKVAFRPGV